MFGIQGIGADTTANSLSFNDFGDVAVLAIAAADRPGIGEAGGPQRCCCALRDTLPAEGRCSLGLSGIDIRNQSLPDLSRHVATQLGLDTSGVHRRGPHTTRLVPSIELEIGR